MLTTLANRALFVTDFHPGYYVKGHMAADPETPELHQQVGLQALSCFLVHVDYVIIKTEIRVYNGIRLLKTPHSFYELLIS